MKLIKYFRLFIMTDKVPHFDLENIASASKKSTLKYVDDEKIIIDGSKIGWFEVILGLGLLVYLIHGSYDIAHLPPDGSLDGWSGIITHLCVGAVGIILLFIAIHGFSGYFKKFEFNRKNGTITYPNPFSASTMKFSRAKFFFWAYSGITTDPTQVALAHENGYTWSLLGHPPAEVFSLFVWYMDKNRPLPPGTAFDAFREKDEKRRLEEGFPNYLYPSVLPISDLNREAYLKEHPKEEEPHYSAEEVDMLPSFVGNTDIWLLLNKKEPQTNNVDGIAIVLACVEKDGSTSLLEMMGNDKGVLNELGRLVLSMPIWKPGRKDGEIVRVSFGICLEFTYPKDRKDIYKLDFFPATSYYNRKAMANEEVGIYIY